MSSRALELPPPIWLGAGQRRQRRRRRLQPRGGGGPRGLRPAPARRLCSLHSNISSCKHPARSRSGSKKDRCSRARRSPPCGAENRCLGHATGKPRHSAGSRPAARGRTGPEQVGDRWPREKTPLSPRRAPFAQRPTRGTGALRCAP